MKKDDSPFGWKVFESCEPNPVDSSLLMSNWFSRLILFDRLFDDNDEIDVNRTDLNGENSFDKLSNWLDLTNLELFKVLSNPFDDIWSLSTQVYKKINL